MDAVIALCEKLGGRRARRSAPSPTRAGCASCAAASCVGDMPVRALVDDCPLYDLEPEQPAEPIYPAAAADARAGHGASRDPARAAQLAEHRLAPAAVRAVRLDRAVAHGAPRPQQADAAVLALPDGAALAVSIDCNGRRVAADPYRGAIEAVLECASNLACVGRRAARDDQQPQLRQPREAPYRLAADRGRPRPGRGMQGAERTDRRRQRLALQRGSDRPDLSHAGDRDGRPHARRTAGGQGRASPPRATRSRSRGPSGRRWPRASSPSSTASRSRARSRRSTSRRSAPRRPRSATRSARARSPAPTTSRRAAWRSPWPSAAWRGTSARASISAAPAERTTCSARAPAASCSARPRRHSMS